MKHGFVRVAAASPDVRVADCDFNEKKIIELIVSAARKQVKLLVFPELCITAYTCGELFLQDLLLEGAKKSLSHIVQASAGKDMIVVVGLPFAQNGCLYNTAAVMKDGRLLGLVPKSFIPNYSEFYEGRHFTAAPDENHMVEWEEEQIPFGPKLLFTCTNLADFILAAEICEDVWVPNPPSISHVQAGATVICNLSASNETTGKDSYRRELVKGQSGRLICGYIYATAGEGESTTDLVFSGHNMIAENGQLLAEAERFQNGLIMTELDVDRLAGERRRKTTYAGAACGGYRKIPFVFETEGTYLDVTLTPLSRCFDKSPFVPGGKADRDERCSEITSIQALGLKKRLIHTGAGYAVIGVSGGLDSTLALLVCCKAFDLCGLPRDHIIAVTMPCFGTTGRTYRNAVALARELGATLREIPVKDAVLQHFKDIGHNGEIHDVTYENAQARERTQVLMDLANEYGGLVIGTGDMSELALGWATYNGDHMSMYGVNAGVPKTLVRYLVLYFAEYLEQIMPKKEEEPGQAADVRPFLSDVLYDILDTPVSPELLPPKDGVTTQKTEELVGPYELHDFFLYYMVRFGFTPSKIYRLACLTFAGDYEEAVIGHWLQVFYKRFFSQQYKRSCIPDGPKVGSVSLSPRGDWKMPSDACVDLWMKDLEEALRHTCQDSII